MKNLTTSSRPTKPSLSNLSSCMSGYDPQAMPVKQAQAIIRDFVTPIVEIETLALRYALGSVLATDIVSPIDVPAHDNSAMDGYAFNATDLRQDDDTVLVVVGTALAGRAYHGPLNPGQAIRIMTGALMPDEFDTVIPQEFVSTSGPTDSPRRTVTIPAAAVKAGANRRMAGEDLKAGTPALFKGRMLRPADLGLLASLGIADIPVMRRLRVAFFSTGDELRSVGEPLEPGCVYDSNRYTLYGMLRRLGCDIIDLGVVGDAPQALETAFRTACENADAIVTSGGVSVGDADYTKQIMAKLGNVAFWKINMRPGRPLAFGSIRSAGKQALFFGLPGNPVAVMISFYFFARNALLQMMGAQAAELPLMRVTAVVDIRKKAGHTEYQRGILTMTNKQWMVRPTATQGSGILRSMVEANCIIVLPHDQGDVASGDMVEVMLFDGLI